MQPLARDGYTSAQIQSLIRDAEAVGTSAGLELLDASLNVLEDLTDRFEGGTVTRANYATLHGTSSLKIAAELSWGTAIIRPYLMMSGRIPLDGTTVTARFNLGAYLTNSPKTELGESTITHEVDGFDILHWLNTPVGEAFVVADGTSYLDAVATILNAQGLTKYNIDQTSAGLILDSPKVWAFDDNTTWLNIINDLLAAIGYQGIFSDWDGTLRVQPYILPTDRATEWLYTSDGTTSMLDNKRTVTRDYFDAPNQWVFYWSKDPATAQPVEGAGIYTYTNDTNGPTSVSERGRVISAKPERIDVADQASLIGAAQQRIESDIRLKTTVEASSFPNPLHWHFDRITLADPAFGSIAEGLAVRWTLPLNGGDMSHEWSLI